MSGFSVGITQYGAEITIAEDSSFPDGIRLLHAEATKWLEGCIENGTSGIGPKAVIEEIEMILHDPGIMDDSDQWEDMSFYGPNVEFWIFEN